MTAKPVSKTRRPSPAPTRGWIEAYLPPEGVPISFQLASLGARFGAQFLDVLITVSAVVALLYLFGFVVVLPWTSWVSLFVLLTFLARVPYYIISELVWNGRTLGKRIVRLRVISADGRRLMPHQIAARNLLKEIEFFTPVTFLFALPQLPGAIVAVLLVWVVIIIAVPSFSKQRQRIGDIIAGTYVIATPKTVLLSDLAVTRPGSTQTFSFLPAHLGIYGRYELQTLEAILRNTRATTSDQQAIERIVDTIVRKIDYPERIDPAARLPFLFAFYRAQRQYLESRKLFGDAREDKFHNTGTP